MSATVEMRIVEMKLMMVFFDRRVTPHEFNLGNRGKSTIQKSMKKVIEQHYPIKYAL